MIYDITIRITEVETSNLEQLEIICEMLAEICDSVCRKCDYDTVKRFGFANYVMEELKE